ncbi:MAG: hypothetical protein ABDH20_10635 [Thermus sp.]
MGVEQLKALTRTIGGLVVRVERGKARLLEAERHHPLVVEAALEAAQEVLRELPPGDYDIVVTPWRVTTRKR